MDFDGVIHSYTSGWKGADIISDGPVDGVFDFLEKASEKFQIAIYSSRSHQSGGIEAMRNWIMDCIQDGAGVIPQWVREVWWSDVKPPAMISIDDRAIQFNGVFPDVGELINFKPWNKK